MPAAAALLTGNFAADGTLSVLVEQIYASNFTLLLSGDFDSGSVAIEGGTRSAKEPVLITSIGNGSTHTALAMTLAGAYNFEAVCTELSFVLTGATAPDLDLVLYSEARP